MTLFDFMKYKGNDKRLIYPDIRATIVTKFILVLVVVQILHRRHRSEVG